MKKHIKILSIILVLVVFTLFALGSESSGEKTASTNSEASANLNESIATSLPNDDNDSQSSSEYDSTEELEEINPDIPLGTSYVLNQGSYLCGEDIPAGRYVVVWESGNQFGGTLNATSGAKYLDSYVSIGPGESYTCILSAGDAFDISLSSMRFTKITSLPNDNYLQADGSYILGSGYFFEGIDIPEGKYNVTAVGGNQFGITISTKSKSYIALDQGETYNNLRLDHMGVALEISLGSAKFEPVS